MQAFLRKPNREILFATIWTTLKLSWKSSLNFHAPTLGSWNFQQVFIVIIFASWARVICAIVVELFDTNDIFDRTTLKLSWKSSLNFHAPTLGFWNVQQVFIVSKYNYLRKLRQGDLRKRKLLCTYYSINEANIL